jgi:hypothetical protein
MGEHTQDLYFLIGMTESAAYEIAQDHGYTVRIVKRDNVSFPVTYDWKAMRVNFTVADNRVVSLDVG